MVRISFPLQKLFQADQILDQHLPCLAAFIGTHDPGRFKLVDDPSGAVVTDREFPLDKGG